MLTVKIGSHPNSISFQMRDWAFYKSCPRNYSKTDYYPDGMETLLISTYLFCLVFSRAQSQSQMIYPYAQRLALKYVSNIP